MDNEIYDIISSDLSSYEINSSTTVRPSTSSTFNTEN